MMHSDRELKSEAQDTVSLFWPNDIHLEDDEEKYVILGYIINRFKMVIVDVIKRDEFKELNGKVERTILKKLEIIGTINFRSKKLNSKMMYYDFVHDKLLVSSNEVLIYFKPPKSWKLEYYSLDPITINIFWNNNDQARSMVFEKFTTDEYNKKMNYHWTDKGKENGNKNEMREVLRMINLTNFIRSKINPTISTSVFPKMRSDLKASLELIFTIVSFLYNLLIQKMCYLISNLLTYPFFKLKYKLPDDERYPIGVSFVLISYSFHQLNFRIRQFYNLPLQFNKLKFSKTEGEASILKGTRFSPSEYIKFYNTVWLIINDLFLGVIFSNVLRANHDFIVSAFQSYIPLYEALLSNTISWLMNSPAGFKLNNELASFLGQLIFWVLDLWRSTTLRWIQSNIGELLQMVEILTRYCGLSLFLSMSLDLTNIFFLNIYGFYVACTRLYSWQLNIVRSLFRLFYGKKYNILRNRVDSNDYEFDQLMLGIIIFTILIYLLPTVFIFYLTFVLARLTILFVSSVLKFLLISLNHIPIVVLLLKLKNQERLPAGLLLDVQRSGFHLKSRSLTMKQIYRSHMNSMLRFNLFNLNHQTIFEQVKSYNLKTTIHTNYVSDSDFEQEKYRMSDVVANWKRVSIMNLIKIVLFGETIKDYDYKRMF